MACLTQLSPPGCPRQFFKALETLIALGGRSGKEWRRNTQRVIPFKAFQPKVSFREPANQDEEKAKVEESLPSIKMIAFRARKRLSDIEIQAGSVYNMVATA